MPYDEATGAYVPTVHHRHNSQDHPSCGQTGNTSVTDNWGQVTCQKCYKSYDYFTYQQAQQAIQRRNEAISDAAVKEAIATVFTTAREIAEARGYCDTYHEVEAAIIDALPYEVPAVEREYEVEVEFEVALTYYDTITVSATSRDAAETKVTEDPEFFLPDMLVNFAPDNGYTDSIRVTAPSVNAS
jgi:hypothetical protein